MWILPFDIATRFNDCKVNLQTRFSRRKELDELYIAMRDGCRLSALYGVPKLQTKNELRAVVLVHGFAAEKTENGLFLQTATRLLSEGYVVLTYDWRGLGKSDGDFSNSSLETHVNDFRIVTEWLRKKERISPAETCVVGFSLGAVVVAKAVQLGKKLGGVVFWSPAMTPSLDMWPRYNTEEINDKLNSDGFVVKRDNNVKLGSSILKSLRDTDLGERAFDLGIPLLVCHGSNDARIPIAASRFCFEVVVRKKIDKVFFAEFIGASHSFRPAKRFRNHLLKLLTNWLENAAVREGQSQSRVFLQAGVKSRLRAAQPNSIDPKPETRIQLAL